MDDLVHDQLEFLRIDAQHDDRVYEISTCPLFTHPVLQYAMGPSQLPNGTAAANGNGNGNGNDSGNINGDTNGNGNALASASLTQWGLLGGDVNGLALAKKDGYSVHNDPRAFVNIASPSSTFICGSQGSGKSHTLSCLLENYLVRSVTNTLPNPLTGIVFYYDSLTSDFAGSPCEAAYLSSNPDVTVRVLCSRTNIANIRRIYSHLPNVKIEALRINESDLNTERMNVLMGVNKAQSAGGTLPLYLGVIERILRELREEQQENGGAFNYGKFKSRVKEAALTDAQLGPLQQRLETLESFMVERQAKAVDIFKPKNKNPKKKDGSQEELAKKGPVAGNDWTAKPGQLTIVDLSCPCVTAEMACSLYHISLSLFLEQKSDVGFVVALDEAHQFMTDSGECRSLTDGLLRTIRLQRHLGARVIISTQEPTISPQLLDLCSTTIVHRFSSPAWHKALIGHLAGASMCADGGIKEEEASAEEEKEKEKNRFVGVRPLSFSGSMELFQEIVRLATGEALVFAPNAIVGMAGAEGKLVPVRLGHGVLKLRMRKRVTQDGGRSVLAG